MQGMSKKEIAYVFAVIMIGLALLIGETAYAPGLSLSGILLFTPLLLITEVSPIIIPGVGTMTVGFIVCLAAALIIGPASAVWVAAIGSISLDVEVRKLEYWFMTAFNSAQVVISVAAAGHVFSALGGIPGKVNLPGDIPRIILAAFAHYMINSGTVSIITAMRRGRPILGEWTRNMRAFLPNLLALTPLAALMAITYQLAGLYGILLFLIPMMLARHSFQMYTDMRVTYLSTIRALAKSIDIKDKYTGGHSERVAQYAVSIGRRMGLKTNDLEMLEYVALLHDIGKIGVPEAVLNKPGKLELGERSQINSHAAVGAEIISQVPFLSRGVEAVRHHHEWYNGNGYPDQVKGQEISQWARIIAVADAFDAMTSDRPYRKAWTVGQAAEELIRCSDTQFDPEVVKVFLTVLVPKLQAEKEAAAGAH